MRMPRYSSSAVLSGSLPRTSAQSRFIARSTAAASALPPPRPASSGMCFSIWISAPNGRPVTSRNSWAALNAVLRPSSGMCGFEHVRRIWPESFSATRTLSHSETDCITMSTVW